MGEINRLGKARTHGVTLRATLHAMMHCVQPLGLLFRHCAEQLPRMSTIDNIARNELAELLDVIFAFWPFQSLIKTNDLFHFFYFSPLKAEQ